MEKLELKHLSPYLPYKLRFKDTYAGDVGAYEMTTFNLDNYFRGHIKLFLPILRPLSCLIKEIEHNGEKFTPIDFLEGYMDYDIERLEYWKMQKLFEWHFDVFELIEKGLAIDINTL